MTRSHARAALDKVSEVPTGRFIYLIMIPFGWALVLAGWAVGVLGAGGSVVFLLALVAGGAHLASMVTKVIREAEPWDSASRAAVLVLLVVVTVVFDPRTKDPFNLVKYTALVVGAFTLAALTAAACARGRRAPRWRSGLEWPVVALLAWTAVTTATALYPRQSLLGAYSSYDGLYAALAFAAVFFTMADAFSLRDVKAALSVLYFAAGGIVLFFGILQLHDRTWSGMRWEWIEWGTATFTGTSIWSTFGNPNHLAGFLAMIVPIGLVLALLHQSWWVRALIALMSFVAIVELMHTTARGGWLATLAALGALPVLLWPEVKRRRRVVALVAAGVAMAVGGGAMVLRPAPDLGRHLRAAVDFNGNSTAVQRVEMWKAALHIANDRPVFGTGPDGYRILFPRYQTPRFVRLYGPEQVANGPHNVFMNYLATQGYPGLFAFLAVLAFAALRALDAWHHLRSVELHGQGDDQRRAREGRLVLAAVASSLVAYVVQGSFNVQQIGLMLSFWAMLGLLGIVVRDADVPLGGSEAVPAPRRGSHRGKAKGGRSSRSRPRRSTDRPTRGGWRAEAGAVLAVSAAVVAFAGPASRPYRADHKGTGLADAVGLNPWEPSYLSFYAQADFDSAQRSPDGSREQLAFLHSARSRYRRAMALVPRDARALEKYAEVLLEIHSVFPGDGRWRDTAVAALRAAVVANPHQSRHLESLRRALDSHMAENRS